MEVLPFGSRVAANVRVGRAAATQVIDMAEQMALRILRPSATEIGAEAPIEDGAFLDGPVLDRNAAQQDEATPVKHFRAQPLEHGTKRRQRKILATNVRNIEVAGSHMRQCC